MAGAHGALCRAPARRAPVATGITSPTGVRSGTVAVRRDESTLRQLQVKCRNMVVVKGRWRTSRR
eukprot:scaffold15308_cov27-Tisochrysis_lutea.AAC.2